MRCHSNLAKEERNYTEDVVWVKRNIMTMMPTLQENTNYEKFKKEINNSVQLNRIVD